MKMTQWFKEEAAFLGLAGALLLVSGLYLFINLDITHYHGLNYYFPAFLRYAPWGLVIIFIAAYLRRMSLRFSLVFEVLWKLYFVYLVSAIACAAIQYTPFPLIDAKLNAIDHLMGFYSGAVFHFSMQHHWIKIISLFAYKHLGYELFLLPIVFAFLCEKRSVRIFFLTNLIATFIAYNIYYFFPTTEPSHVIPGINFLQGQYDVVAQWYEIHNHLTNYMNIGALVGFPSFHVIWAIVVTYLCRPRKWLFYPVMVFNAIVIISTLTLGWHFLTDVIAAFAVAFASIYVAERLLPKENQLQIAVKESESVSVSSRQLCQRLNRQALNDDSEYDDAIRHR